MTERITKLITPLPLSNTGALGTQSITSDIPDLLQPNWSLSLPRFKDKKDMLEYGQKLLHSKSSGAATRRKSAAAVEIPESNIVNVQDEYPVDYSEMRHQASSLAQNSYRINQFLNLADTYITQHIAKTQMTLSQITRGSSRGSYLAGVGNLTAANSAKGKDGQEGAQSTTRALLEGASGVRSSSNQNRKGGMDAITLLRAISRTETAVESGKKNAAAR